MATHRVMVIDNEEGICRLAEAVLADAGYDVEWFTRSFEAVERFRGGGYDVVVTDVKMPGIDGLEVLERVRAEAPGVPVIVITAFATVELSIQALRKGAYDMLTKPFEPEELLFRVRNALRHTALAAENRELRDELAGKASFGAVVGESPALTAVLETARKVAVRNIPVLVTGESGTGKELVAQAIHAHSPRRTGRFVAINCGALPESLLNSELFGYKRGAFTGAERDRQGLLEAADQGTLFLDEVGTLPPAVQNSLLRFLQEGEFYRVGDPRPRRVDVRVISATNSDLAAAVGEGTFREDLYYRLNVVHLHLPPLRARREDIPLLAALFVKEQNERFATRVRGLTPGAVEALRRHPWPGNVRQLRNAITAAMAVTGGEVIDREALQPFLQEDGPAGEACAAGAPVLEYAEALARFEADYLGRLLHWTGGNVEEASRRSGMNAATIYRKMKRYGVPRNGRG
ncbi:MAG: sigma-54 dependent transcriptional regulator [Deferrisomatales bacterium]